MSDGILPYESWTFQLRDDVGTDTEPSFATKSAKLSTASERLLAIPAKEVTWDRHRAVVCHEIRQGERGQRAFVGYSSEGGAIGTDTEPPFAAKSAKSSTASERLLAIPAKESLGIDI